MKVNIIPKGVKEPVCYSGQTGFYVAQMIKEDMLWAKEVVRMKAYEKEKDLWNDIFADYKPADLNTMRLSVEPTFDACLQIFADKTRRVLDFGCGTGDILFQYAQCGKDKKGVGIDEAEKGIAFACATARLSGYHQLHFLTGDENLLASFEEEEFDGIILSNVLDVMPDKIAHETIEKLNRILKKGGYWFIKLNPYYSNKELQELDYKRMGFHLYEEDGVLRLRQESTKHWEKALDKLGEIERYLEFPYPWQTGMNRLFLVRK